MQQKTIKIFHNLLLFLELQLLISIVTLPIAIAWGLGISSMSIIGNFIFPHFLSIFICISFLIFMCSLLSIPYDYIMIALEWVCNTWSYALSFGSHDWIIGYPYHLFYIVCLCTLVAISLYIYQHHCQTKRIYILMTLLCLIHSLKIMLNSSYQHTVIHHGYKKFYIMKKNNIIYAFDVGALSCRPSSRSWIEYSLLPHMIQAIGETHINLLTVCTPNSRTNSALKEIVDIIPINQIVTLSHKIS